MILNKKILFKKQLDQAKEEIAELKRMVAEMQKKPKEEDIFSDDEPKIAKVNYKWRKLQEGINGR